MPQSATAPRPPSQHRASLRVPFRDVDMHGHVHNAMFLSYFEAAINDFLRDRGLAPHFDPASAVQVYHVKKAELTFEAPAFFEDELQFRVRIARIGRSSLSYGGEIVRCADETLCATVVVVWVCVDPATRRPCPFPEATRLALDQVASEPG
ncbi:MAG: acyl-CoA thioesterase [Salinarimonas sp.]